MTFSRAGFTGSQRHGLFWAGDEDSTWDAFASSMIAGLTAASSGIVYWGWDIAGFSGPVPDAELYLRAFGASVYVPVMQYHSEFNHHQRPLRDRTPWNIAEQSGNADVVALARAFVQQRERLAPYLAEQARRAIDTDRPLMRPLLFDHAADPRIWAHPDEFQLGDDLLVHPITQPGVTSWTTYLPAGSWRTTGGELVDGGTLHEATYSLGQVPVFVRDEAWERLRHVWA